MQSSSKKKGGLPPPPSPPAGLIWNKTDDPRCSTATDLEEPSFIVPSRSSSASTEKSHDSETTKVQSRASTEPQCRPASTEPPWEKRSRASTELQCRHASTEPPWEKRSRASTEPQSAAVKKYVDAKEAEMNMSKRALLKELYEDINCDYLDLSSMRRDSLSETQKADRSKQEEVSAKITDDAKHCVKNIFHGPQNEMMKIATWYILRKAKSRLEEEENREDSQRSINFEESINSTATSSSVTTNQHVEVTTGVAAHHVNPSSVSCSQIVAPTTSVHYPQPASTPLPLISPSKFPQPVPHPSQFPQTVPHPSQFTQHVPRPSQFTQPVPHPSQFTQHVPRPSQFPQHVPRPSQFPRPVPHSSQFPQQFPPPLPLVSPLQFPQSVPPPNLLQYQKRDVVSTMSQSAAVFPPTSHAPPQFPPQNYPQFPSQLSPNNYLPNIAKSNTNYALQHQNYQYPLPSESFDNPVRFDLPHANTSSVNLSSFKQSTSQNSTIQKPVSNLYSYLQFADANVKKPSKISPLKHEKPARHNSSVSCYEYHLKQSHPVKIRASTKKANTSGEILVETPNNETKTLAKPLISSSTPTNSTSELMKKIDAVAKNINSEIRDPRIRKRLLETSSSSEPARKRIKIIEPQAQDESTKIQESPKADKGTKVRESTKVQEGPKADKGTKVRESTKVQEGPKADKGTKVRESTKVQEGPKADKGTKVRESTKAREGAKMGEGTKAAAKINVPSSSSVKRITGTSQEKHKSKHEQTRKPDVKPKATKTTADTAMANECDKDEGEFVIVEVPVASVSTETTSTGLPSAELKITNTNRLQRNPRIVDESSIDDGEIEVVDVVAENMVVNTQQGVSGNKDMNTKDGSSNELFDNYSCKSGKYMLPKAKVSIKKLTDEEVDKFTKRVLPSRKCKKN